MKTVSEYLETFPEPYRTQAINNFNGNRNDTFWIGKNKECANVKEALGSAFSWNYSKEGDDYWSNFYNSLIISV